jgi:hypothetical protein
MSAEEQVLEERKVKALERIALNLESLTIWVEEVDKEEWGERLAWYLSLWKEKFIDDK